MNQHPYPDKKTGPKTDLKTKAAWSLAVMKVSCPTCGSSPGFYCERTPPAKTAGQKRWPPHDDRSLELRKIMPTAGMIRANVCL